MDCGPIFCRIWLSDDDGSMGVFGLNGGPDNYMLCDPSASKTPTLSLDLAVLHYCPQTANHPSPPRVVGLVRYLDSLAT